MEYWETTKKRAQTSLAVWRIHMPTLKVGRRGMEDLEALIDLFEPRVQDCVARQYDVDSCHHERRTSLEIMKLLSLQVPQLIRGNLSEDELLMKDLKQVFRVSPRSENAILDRARALYPIWVRADAAMAALTPSQPPITRRLQGETQTAAMLKARIDGYSTLVQETSNAMGLMKAALKALRDLDKETDQLNKNWYKLARMTFDSGSAEAKALDKIPTEKGMPMPETVEMATLDQGGENGLQVLVSYIAGGGTHATAQRVKWQIVGIDADFIHSAPLEASGNALGPFTVGQTVRVITEVSNSAGTRTSAPRKIVIEVAI